MKAVVGWIVMGLLIMYSQADAQGVRAEVSAFSFYNFPPYRMYFPYSVSNEPVFPTLMYSGGYGFFSLWLPEDPLYLLPTQAATPSVRDRNSDIAPVWKPIDRQVYDWCGSFQPNRPRDPLTKKATSTPAERGESVILIEPAVQPANAPERNDAPPQRRTVPGRGPRPGHAAFPIPR